MFSESKRGESMGRETRTLTLALTLTLIGRRINEERVVSLEKEMEVG